MQIHNNFSFDFLLPLPPSDAPSTCSGVYKIYKDDTLVLTHTNTGVFGELALLYNQPRWEKYFEYQINQLYKIYTDVQVYRYTKIYTDMYICKPARSMLYLFDQFVACLSSI